MPTINLERLRQDGPLRVRVTYGVAAGESDERFSCVIVGVSPTGPKHVEVTVELSDAEHERLRASKR
jgi:hypothetical protein